MTTGRINQVACRARTPHPSKEGTPHEPAVPPTERTRRPTHPHDAPPRQEETRRARRKDAATLAAARACAVIWCVRIRTRPALERRQNALAAESQQSQQRTARADVQRVHSVPLPPAGRTRRAAQERQMHTLHRPDAPFDASVTEAQAATHESQVKATGFRLRPRASHGVQGHPPQQSLTRLGRNRRPLHA